MIERFFTDEDGQTLVEYGLMTSLVALVTILVLRLMGNRIRNTFNRAGNQFTH